MFMNVVIGEPLCSPQDVLAFDEKDWEENEKKQTLFTHSRYLPAIMKEAGIVSSISEVRRNRPDLSIVLTKPDFIEVKWGKKRLFIVVGK